MGFREIWVSLVSWKNDKHKFIWVYLGSLLDRLLLTANVNIYLCLILLFILGIFENDMILPCLD